MPQNSFYRYSCNEFELKILKGTKQNKKTPKNPYKEKARIMSKGQPKKKKKQQNQTHKSFRYLNYRIKIFKTIFYIFR